MAAGVLQQPAMHLPYRGKLRANFIKKKSSQKQSCISLNSSTHTKALGPAGEDSVLLRGSLLYKSNGIVLYISKWDEDLMMCVRFKAVFAIGCDFFQTTKNIRSDHIFSHLKYVFCFFFWGGGEGRVHFILGLIPLQNSREFHYQGKHKS